MTSIEVSKEIEQLVSKYADVSTPVDFLQKLAEAAKLESANILLHERLARDIYSIFGKDEDSGEFESESGRRLMSASRVRHYHHASSTLVFHTEAEIEFNMAEERNTKRKRHSNNNTALEEPIIIKVQFSEQTLGAGSGTSPGSAKREKGVTVLEAPYKSINLIITMRRGLAGLDQATLVDFQLLTSGCSPSSERITLQELMGREGADEGSEDGSEGGSRSGSEGGSGRECSDGEVEGDDEDHGAVEGNDGDNKSLGSWFGSEGHEGSDDEEGGSEGEEQGSEDGSETGIDTADYYNVSVDTEALAKLKEWLGFKSLQEQQDEEEAEAAAAEEERERQRASKKNSKKSSKVGSKEAPSKSKGKKQAQAPPIPEPSEPSEQSEQSEEESDAEEGEEDGGEEEPSAYEVDPALGDLLQFLLSLPYVDEAWDIHDLILNHELGANEEEGSEGGSEESDQFCMPCCR